MSSLESWWHWLWKANCYVTLLRNCLLHRTAACFSVYCTFQRERERGRGRENTPVTWEGGNKRCYSRKWSNSYSAWRVRRVFKFLEENCTVPRQGTAGVAILQPLKYRTPLFSGRRRRPDRWRSRINNTGWLHGLNIIQLPRSFLLLKPAGSTSGNLIKMSTQVAEGRVRREEAGPGLRGVGESFKLKRRSPQVPGQPRRRRCT